MLIPKHEAAVTSGFSIQLRCTHCDSLITIPYKMTAKLPWTTRCASCGKQFGIDCPTLASQIKQFVSLCQQLKASEEILADAAIAVTVGNSEVKIPYKLLLTRLRSTFDFEVDGRKITVSSRTEPLGIGEAFAKEMT
jgi:hypothetical protein